MNYTESYNQKSTNQILNPQFHFMENFGIAASEDNKAFLSILSHNIKNPFGALLGYSDLLVEDFFELSDQEKINYASELKKTANLTYRYLERLFEWVYYKMNKYKIKFESLNLREVIADSLNNLLPGADFTGEINFSIDENIKIIADYDSILKAFSYILENSLKYCSKDGLINISAKKEEDFIIIEIVDNGIGIPESEISKLFDISKNIAKHNENIAPGTGLGLILTEEILKLNRGSIKVVSQSNIGTKVKLKLYST